MEGKGGDRRKGKGRKRTGGEGKEREGERGGKGKGKGRGRKALPKEKFATTAQRETKSTLLQL